MVLPTEREAINLKKKMRFLIHSLRDFIFVLVIHGDCFVGAHLECHPNLQKGELKEGGLYCRFQGDRFNLFIKHERAQKKISTALLIL